MKISFLGCSDARGLDTESPTWDITCSLWVCAVGLSFTATASSSSSAHTDPSPLEIRA